jgi:hypothetical protein
MSLFHCKHSNTNKNLASEKLSKLTNSCPIDVQLRSQLDDAIASECPFCGDLMIREISLPFVLPEEARQVTSWEIKPHNLGNQRTLSLPL